MTTPSCLTSNPVSRWQETSLSPTWFEEQSKTSDRTVADLQDSPAQRRAAIASAIKRSSRPPTAADHEIWRQTLLEAGTGRLSAPRKIRKSDLSAHRPLSHRFGISQLTSKGLLKIRNIDDFTASFVNSTTAVFERLYHNGIDDLVSMMDTISSLGYACRLIKADFKGAYRTCPAL